MASRSTLGRSMLAMLVIGFGLAWGRCWLKRENWPGEFGPMVILSHIALAFSILSQKRQRRFWLVTVVVGLGLSLGFFSSSGEFRASMLMSWIVPLEERLLERFSFDRIVGIKPEKWDRHRSSLARASPIFLDRSIQQKTALIQRSRSFQAGYFTVSAEVLILYDSDGRPKMELEDQVILGILETPLALIGGLLFAILRRKSPALVSPNDLASGQGL